MAKRQKPEVTCLFYICHVENLSSILEHGILSHSTVEERQLPFKRIYDAEIVSNRKGKITPDGKSLWDYANVYFQSRNPMLYRVLREIGADSIVIVGVSPQAAALPGALVSDGNAANSATQIYPSAEGLKRVVKGWDTIQSEWWSSSDGSKRRIMAEALIPKEIPPSLIQSVFVKGHKIVKQVRPLVSGLKVDVIPEPRMFFRPNWRHRVTEKLFLAEGDMFFSEMQTLTVSVNTAGVMGKGVASRAKYQFPDVYVVYQDACRSKRLAMGKPFLYKRESSLDDELLDEPSNVKQVNDVKWFLLFATKNHWRYNSDRDGISTGLDWLVKNQAKNQIQSLALPALGCGLGNLEWRDIGPLMCRKLANLDIPVAIYLPRERATDPEFLTTEYLLGTQAG